VGAVVAGGVGRGIGALWMGIAHSVGWAARGVGKQAATAKEIDPEHRRDGAGLLLLGLAILIGVAVWAGSAGPLGKWLADAIRLFFGGLAVLLPLLLLYGAVRLMRRPADPEHRGRSLVGWTAIVLSTAALLHIAQQPADNLAVDKAGGLLGYGVGGVLESAVTAWVAVPLLVLLFVFGLLVITATPINKIPERMMLLVDVLTSTSTSRNRSSRSSPGVRRGAGRGRSPTSA
jgi:S-DNA-T family DNA segregation ATPase FtsK/SpoIIIE